MFHHSPLFFLFGAGLKVGTVNGKGQKKKKKKNNLFNKKGPPPKIFFLFEVTSSFKITLREKKMSLKQAHPKKIYRPTNQKTNRQFKSYFSY